MLIFADGMCRVPSILKVHRLYLCQINGSRSVRENNVNGFLGLNNNNMTVIQIDHADGYMCNLVLSPSNYCNDWCR